MKETNFLLVLFATAIFSCNQPRNKSIEVSEAEKVQEVAADAILYAINTETSTITWIGSKPNGKHNGVIKLTEGSLSIEDNQITGGKVIIDMNSLACIDLVDDEENANKLIRHLKSADFFDVATHPTAEFVITSVETYQATDSVKIKEEFESEFQPTASNEHIVENPTHKITGNLILRGTALSIAFPAKITTTETSVKASAKFNIDRTLWGVTYGDETSVANKAKDKFIYNTVNIGFTVDSYKVENKTEE